MDGAERLDGLDARLLNALLADGRLSYRKLSRKLGVAAATVMSRVQRLEKAGAIAGYSARLDYERLGYDVTVLIELRISKGKLFEVERQIAGHPSVFAIYDHTGPFDATILARFRTRKAMDGFLKRIQTFDFVERTETKLVLNTIKEQPQKVA
ncbi:MAG TPA: Lrp/AsnC family transcriptional regulator [archaeon]|nr:Lrp/AsnC family transcriptional regulator [archaeon]